MIRTYNRDELRKCFRSAKPYPHIMLENFLDPAAAEEIACSYPNFDTAASLGFVFSALNEQKKVQVTDSAKFPGPVRRLNEVLASPHFLADLSYITGIPNLIADEQLAGGGIHVTGSGGRLDVHVDFNYNQASQLHRRLNILLYLNPVWEEGWGGEIELWDEHVKHCGLRLQPILNRCLIFETSQTSYHGVRPITAPPGTERKSFAAYYYTREAPVGWNGEMHSTVFRARPDERLRGYALMPAERLRNEVSAGLRWVKRRVKQILISAS